MEINLKIEEEGQIFEYQFGIENVVIISKLQDRYVRFWIDLELEENMRLVDLNFIEKKTLYSFLEKDYCQLDYVILNNWGINGSNFIVDIDTIRYGRSDEQEI